MVLSPILSATFGRQFTSIILHITAVYINSLFLRVGNRLCETLQLTRVSHGCIIQVSVIKAESSL
jgi:hypothetical protein